MQPVDAPWESAVPEVSQTATTCCQFLVGERLAPVRPKVGASLREAGLQTLDDYDVVAATDLLERSLRLIAQLPDLHRRVLIAVGTIHLLAAEPGYDVSHSEPRWRSTIFVSLPDRADEVGVIRLAESIVHEAMHLTLTNWESERPFVNEEATTQYSPWRHTQRPAQGVLHGVFVFVCIAAFLRRLQKALREPETAKYVRSRIETIHRELALVDLVHLRSSLTQTGVDALARWL